VIAAPVAQALFCGSGLRKRTPLMRKSTRQLKSIVEERRRGIMAQTPQDFERGGA
jgi:hypothetical protein